MRFTPMDLDALIIDSQKPTRYVGGEVNSSPKPLGDARLTWALCFPETYEIGMSNVGFRLLHHVLNLDEAIACERVFMPWPDMIGRMRSQGVPLWSLESRVPVRDFDVVGFSLQFESAYTSVLEMLELSGIPLLATQRRASDPVVIGGGPCVYDPEPVSPFFDAFSIGEGEEQLVAISRVVEEWRACHPVARDGLPALPSREETCAALRRDISEPAAAMDGARMELLRRLAAIPGVMVPCLFRPAFDFGAPALSAMEPLLPGHERIRKSVMPDLDMVPQPSRPIVPFMQTVHDRLPIEIQRGCVRGCRFCQAGMLTRPSRQRSPDKVLELATNGLKATGYEEVGFLSLSAGDYGCINELLSAFFDRFEPERVAISLPSLRTETMNDRLAEQIGRVRKSGFTIAPEAATDRLRRVINKGNSEENLLKAIQSVFQSGWSLIKLYFMIGLPTETDEDVLAIADLAKKAYWNAKAIRPWAQIHASVSTFVPKPFTPFQWDPMIPVEETLRRHVLLRSSFPKKGGLALKYHEGHSSLIEGALARGDRRMALAVYAAWSEGQILDGWSEHFSFDRWMAGSAAMEKAYGLSLKTAACRERGLSECLPWSMLDCGVTDAFLLDERQKSRDGVVTGTCATGSCNGCGACDFDQLMNRLKGDQAAKDGWNAKPSGSDDGAMVQDADDAAGKVSPFAGNAAESETDTGADSSAIEAPASAPSSGADENAPAEATADADADATSPSAAECEAKAPGVLPQESDEAKPALPKGVQPPQIWVRVTYAKTGRAIAVSHLETITLLQRALRRSGWPVSFTQGFNPKPRLAFSPACPVGIESNAEFLDVRLTRECDVGWLKETLAPELPVNFPLVSIERPDGKPEATNESIRALRYRVRFAPSVQVHGGVGQAVQRFCATDSVIVHREGSKSKAGKDIELKEIVWDVEALGEREAAFTLRSGNEATAKPAEVVQAVFGVPAGTGDGVRMLKDSVIWKHSGD